MVTKTKTTKTTRGTTKVATGTVNTPVTTTPATTSVTPSTRSGVGSTNSGRRFFKVIPDRVDSNTWTLQLNGRVIRRIAAKHDLIREAQVRARAAAPSVLEIRRSNGTFGEYRRYN